MKRTPVFLCAIGVGLIFTASFFALRKTPVRRASQTVPPRSGIDSTPKRVASPTPVSPPQSEPAPAPSRVPPSFALPASAKPTSELVNRGNATARDGAETYMWASINRQTEVAASLIKWYGGPDEGTWTYGANNEFLKVPEPWQSQIKTPERLIAIMHQNELASFGAFEIKHTEVIGPKDELITVRWFAPDGSFVDQLFLMGLTPIGWRRETHPGYVVRLAKQLQESSALQGPR